MLRQYLSGYGREKVMAFDLSDKEIILDQHKMRTYIVF
jgi:hypothetical protein